MKKVLTVMLIGWTLSNTVQIQTTNVEQKQTDSIRNINTNTSGKEETSPVQQEQQPQEEERQQQEETIATKSVESTTSSGSKEGPFIEIPNILLIGGQKCGSSALAVWLFGQGVCGGEIFDNELEWYKKEIHFFDGMTGPNRFPEGTQSYSKRFKHCYANNYTGVTSDGPLVMDATPETILRPDRVHELYKDYPNQMKKLRIMLIVRDPVARQLSWYNHKIRGVLRNRASNTTNPWWYDDALHKDGSIMTIDEYLDDVFLPNFGNIEPPFYDAGLYARYLDHWLQYFPPDQILVLSYDELQGNTAKFQWRVKQFLNATHFKDNGVIKESNTGSQHIKHLSCETQQKLQQKYEPENAHFYELMEKKDRPWMQERPFPTFKLSECTVNEQ